MRTAVPDFASSTFFPLIVAKEMGIFKEEGQDVEIVPIRAPGGVESLRDGGVDFSARISLIEGKPVYLRSHCEALSSMTVTKRNGNERTVRNPFIALWEIRRKALCPASRQI